MTMGSYESDGALAEYLLLHYGDQPRAFPYSFGPREAQDFPLRCVRDCFNPQGCSARARALDLGCAVGRSSFEFARHCAQVIGVDSSSRFIAAARQLQRHGWMPFDYADEGDLTIPAKAIVPLDIERERVIFEEGDAHALPANLGEFDVVLMGNLIDRLRDPRRCLQQLSGLLHPGGQLIITSPYTWLTEYTPKENWLGGFERQGQPVHTLDTLRDLLALDFRFSSRQNLPFLIREHARKFQWSVAEASIWIRRE
jgi:putative 4-mercaptohistidine N1-methyltranferase